MKSGSDGKIFLTPKIMGLHDGSKGFSGRERIVNPARINKMPKITTIYSYGINTEPRVMKSVRKRMAPMTP